MEEKYYNGSRFCFVFLLKSAIIELSKKTFGRALVWSQLFTLRVA
jgi:hypothetical protein